MARWRLLLEATAYSFRSTSVLPCSGQSSVQKCLSWQGLGGPIALCMGEYPKGAELVITQKKSLSENRHHLRPMNVFGM
jgi:hypothetical protein